MTTAFVTGAPGWLGTRLVQTLAEGLSEVPSLAAPSEREIRVLAYRDADVSGLERIRGNITIVRGDITDPPSVATFMRGAEGGTVFHAAGIIHPTQGIKQLYAVNELGTGHVLQAARAAGVKRLIHVSSNSPIGVNPSNEHVFNEGAPYHPYMHYGRSKKLAEDLVNAAGAAGPVETVIIRPPWFYGTGQPERQSRFIKMVRDGKAPIIGSGANRRSMAYIDNICQGLLLCERVAQAKGRTYWIADERPYPMTEIIDTIEDVLEQDFSVKVAHKRMRLPGVVAEVAVAGDWVFQTAGLYVTPLHVLGEMNKTIACSVERAQRELDYQPRVTLREGMRRSIQWMLENGQRL